MFSGPACCREVTQTGCEQRCCMSKVFTFPKCCIALLHLLGTAPRALPARLELPRKPCTCTGLPRSSSVWKGQAKSLGMLARLFLQRTMLVRQLPAGDVMLRASLLQAPCIACLLRQRGYATASQRKLALRNWQGHLFPEWSGRGSVAAGAGRARRSPSRQSDPLYDNAPPDVIVLERPPPAGAQPGADADVPRSVAPPTAAPRSRRAQPRRSGAGEVTASASVLARGPGGTEAESKAHGAALAERGGGAEGGSEGVARTPRRNADPFQALGADDRVTVRLLAAPEASGCPWSSLDAVPAQSNSLCPVCLDAKLQLRKCFHIQRSSKGRNFRPAQQARQRGTFQLVRCFVEEPAGFAGAPAGHGRAVTNSGAGGGHPARAARREHCHPVLHRLWQGLAAWVQGSGFLSHAGGAPASLIPARSCRQVRCLIQMSPRAL